MFFANAYVEFLFVTDRDALTSPLVVPTGLGPRFEGGCPLGVALRAFVTHTQRFVSGEVRMRFTPGSAAVSGRRSPHSLYDIGLATYDAGDRFDHAAAVGFIAIWGLPVRTQAARRHGEADDRALLDELGADRLDAAEPVGASR